MINKGYKIINKDYRHLDMQEKQRLIQNARNNSVKTRNSNLKSTKYRKCKIDLPSVRLRKQVLTLLVATAIASTGVGIGVTLGVQKAIGTYNELITVHDVLSEFNDIVSEEVHRTKDNTNYYYDTRGIALRLLDEPDFDLALYGVYNRLMCGTQENKELHMSRILNEAKGFVEENPEKYKNSPKYGYFEGYLEEKGFVDKDGNPSIKVYKEKMNNYVMAVAHMREQRQEISGNSMGVRK